MRNSVCGNHLQGSETIRTIPGPERGQLRFAEVVTKTFSFLVTDLGFKLMSIGPTFVRYESIVTFVNVYHARGSYQVGAEIGLRDDANSIDSQERFSIWEIAHLAGARDDGKEVTVAAESPEVVERDVQRLAELVKRYATKALVGDVQIFDQLRAQQKQEMQKYYL